MNYKPVIFLSTLISYMLGLELLSENEFWLIKLILFYGTCIWAVLMVKIWKVNILEKDDIIDVYIENGKIINVKVNKIK